jgi:hypothetical protein
VVRSVARPSQQLISVFGGHGDGEGTNRTDGGRDASC